MPVGFPSIQEVQPLVYFDATEPLNVEPIILSGDEADLRNAIQALAPLLSDADRAKYRDYIDPKMTKTLRQRYQDWRKRNAR